MSKIFILPNSSTTEFNRIRLKHPKNRLDCDYFYRDDEKKIYELNMRKNSFHSWFWNDRLIQDGNVYILTPIDPLFLMIPIIESKAKQPNNYCSLIDIIADNNNDNNFDSFTIDLLNKIFNEKLLKCIADVKAFESELFIRFNREKTLKWLCLKFEQIKKSLAGNGFHSNHNGGFTINNYKATSTPSTTASTNNSGDQDYSQYNLMALQIISDYIADDYVKELRTIFGIPDIDDDNIHNQQQGKEEIIKDNHHKRKLDSLSSSPAKKFQEKKHQVNDKNKKPKLTSTQKKLIKMDKTGIKDISCYFKKR